MDIGAGIGGIKGTAPVGAPELHRLLGVMNHDFPNELLRRASEALDLRDRDGTPATFTPHDFRRIFATDTANGGLPLHIAAKLLGHLDLNTSRGYVAVYPEEVVEAYQAHLTRRRAFRSEVDYREPSPEEWAEFEQHFRRR
ncbi:MAG: site-specific integrase, partial [Chloroflexota bacterium]|nr:site-specific integrase [Chloroflexota bacterium]